MQATEAGTGCAEMAEQSWLATRKEQMKHCLLFLAGVRQVLKEH